VEPVVEGAGATLRVTGHLSKSARTDAWKPQHGAGMAEDFWRLMRDEARRRRLRELRWRPDEHNPRAWIDPSGKRWHEAQAFAYLNVIDDPVNLRF
jgi:hypothetical protein